MFIWMLSVVTGPGLMTFLTVAVWFKVLLALLIHLGTHCMYWFHLVIPFYVRNVRVGDFISNHAIISCLVGFLQPCSQN